MQRGLPDTKDDSAEHGTAIHSALAKQDLVGLNVEQVDTYDACSGIEKALVATVFGAEALALNPKPFREQRYWIKWKDKAENQHSGQIDCAYRLSTRALIIEYKSLAGEVPGSPQNLQLRDQVVLFDHNNSMLAEIYVAVIQPFVTRKPQIAVYKREDITRAASEMYKRVLASNDPNAKRTPGEVQCKYCKAASAGKCQEYNAWAGKTVIGELSSMAASLVDVTVSEWTPEQCGLFLQQLPIAQKWLDDTKATMKELLKADPTAIPGWTLKDGTNKETITNPQAVFDAFSQKGGSLNQFMECIAVSKGSLKEALAVITKSKGKKLDLEVAAVIGENHEYKQNEPSVVKVKEVI